jgi:hypothetical protein
MKAAFCLIILSFCFVSNSYSQNRPTDPKVLAEQIFSALKNNDYASYEKLFFTEVDCDTMFFNSTASDSAKAKVKKGIISLAKVSKANSKSNFENVLQQSKLNNLDWDLAVLKDVQFKIKNDHNIQSADIFLWIQCNGKDFTLKLDNCAKSNYWLMLEKAEFRIGL